MTLGSLFDGIGGRLCAAHHADGVRTLAGLTRRLQSAWQRHGAAVRRLCDTADRGEVTADAS